MQRYVVDKNFRYKKIAMAVSLAFSVGSGAVLAQSTAGSIYGSADPGAQVTATNEGNGATRSITVGKEGRYQFNSSSQCQTLSPELIRKRSFAKPPTTCTMMELLESNTKFTLFPMTFSRA